MDAEFFVYEHIRPDTGAVFYVGKGKGYRATVASRFHRNKWWMAIVAKAGGFSVRYVAKNLLERDAFALEIDHIKKLRDEGVEICNISSGGDGVVGIPRTPEWLAKIGDAHRGKVISAEVRAKISASLKASGYTPSEETRKKHSERMMGKKIGLGYRHTDEWKAATSERLKGNQYTLGKRHSPETRAKMSAAHAGKRYTAGLTLSLEHRTKVSVALKGKPHPRVSCIACRREVGVRHINSRHLLSCAGAQS